MVQEMDKLQEKENSQRRNTYITKVTKGFGVELP